MLCRRSISRWEGTRYGASAEINAKDGKGPSSTEIGQGHSKTGILAFVSFSTRRFCSNIWQHRKRKRRSRFAYQVTENYLRVENQIQLIAGANSSYCKWNEFYSFVGEERLVVDFQKLGFDCHIFLKLLILDLKHTWKIYVHEPTWDEATSLSDGKASYVNISPYVSGVSWPLNATV